MRGRGVRTKPRKAKDEDERRCCAVCTKEAPTKGEDVGPRSPIELKRAGREKIENARNKETPSDG